MKSGSGLVCFLVVAAKLSTRPHHVGDSAGQRRSGHRRRRLGRHGLACDGRRDVDDEWDSAETSRSHDVRPRWTRPRTGRIRATAGPAIGLRPGTPNAGCDWDSASRVDENVSSTVPTIADRPGCTVTADPVAGAQRRTSRRGSGGTEQVPDVPSTADRLPATDSRSRRGNRPQPSRGRGSSGPNPSA